MCECHRSAVCVWAGFPLFPPPCHAPSMLYLYLPLVTFCNCHFIFCLYLFLCISHFSVCMPACLSVRPSVRLCVRLCVRLYVCPPVCLSFCQSACWFQSLVLHSLPQSVRVPSILSHSAKCSCRVATLKLCNGKNRTWSHSIATDCEASPALVH